jgi:hypothetical protein
MTTLEQANLKPPVLLAIEEIRAQFAGHLVETWADGDGGAFVRVHALDLSNTYEPETVWIGFHLTFQYPQADVYPHYLPASFRYRDGRNLIAPMHRGHTWQPLGGQAEPAVIVSRRSNRLNAATDTAALKLLKIIDWIRLQ